MIKKTISSLFIIVLCTNVYADKGNEHDSAVLHLTQSVRNHILYLQLAGPTNRDLKSVIASILELNLLQLRKKVISLNANKSRHYSCLMIKTLKNQIIELGEDTGETGFVKEAYELDLTCKSEILTQ